jgi:hypothetical protein
MASLLLQIVSTQIIFVETIESPLALSTYSGLGRAAMQG